MLNSQSLKWFKKFDFLLILWYSPSRRFIMFKFFQWLRQRRQKNKQWELLKIAMREKVNEPNSQFVKIIDAGDSVILIDKNGNQQEIRRSENS